MDIFLYIGISILLLWLSGFFENYAKEVKIKIDDINVGDKIIIKGEKFFVERYSSEGIVEIYKKKDAVSPKENYLVKFGDDIELLSHNVDNKREYITVNGFKGTIGGEYLNKFKI